MARQTRKKSGTGIYQVLRYALSFGAGVRQLSRLTGISFGVIQKLKMINRTDPMIPVIDILKGVWKEYTKWVNDGNKGIFRYEIDP